LIYGLKGVGREFGERGHTSVVLRNLTLNIAPGEQVALLGPSGSGKTTLFRLFNGSIFPSSGQLLYRQTDVATMSNVQLREMRRKIGCIYQQHYLVPGMSALSNTMSGALGRWGVASTLINLVHPRPMEVERAEHCLESVGLKEKRRFRCDQLSGGQQQRLAIARTLMQEPEVILADEPVASLDPVLSHEILDLLVRLADESHLTLLISLHQVELARRHAQRIVALRDGEIAFNAPVQELDERFLDQLYRSSREPYASPITGALPEPAGGNDDADSGQKRPCIR
jgi:phosphonate transport system ATP-binding protein